MGLNTVAVFYNDHFHDIDSAAMAARIANAWAALMHDRKGSYSFGAGRFICQDHADHLQIVAVGRNTGERVTMDEASPEVLARLKDILRWHGYAVRDPGAKRADPPLSSTSSTD